MTLVEYVRSCVIHAISSSKTAILRSYYEKRLSILGTTLDEIVSIEEAGEEEVLSKSRVLKTSLPTASSAIIRAGTSGTSLGG
jgi:hypothetical protein